MKIYFALAVSLLAIAAPCQQKPTPAAAPWWKLTSDLANDGMQGRDTGSPAYQRAAEYVAGHFRADGLQPAGENSTWYQRVDMHQVSLVEAKSSVAIHHPGSDEILHFTTEVTTVPRADFSLDDAKMVFLGYGLPPEGADLKGKIVVYFNSVPAGLTPQDRDSYPMRRSRALAAAGVAAILTIDNLSSIEPPHWPAAYARSVTLLSNPPREAAGPPVIRINPANLGSIMRDEIATQITEEGGHGRPLQNFDIRFTASIRLTVEEKDISSPNIIAILPGSDPKLAPEYVALSAHLDGYGYGTPVFGDSLYNGALDDAAYVATLMDLADQLHKKPPARSLLFCIFTGEEKGLLGSIFYTQHPTVPIAQIVADLNLDQLRPIFPLKILTMEGISDSTLGDTAKTVAAQFQIELRPDHETERRLFSRADNYSFVRVGVPIASFIFGYNPNTPEERTYRDWYARRYHKPQDDLMTPIDWAAAVKFNDFYRALVLAIANDPKRPEWVTTSPYAPKDSKKAE